MTFTIHHLSAPAYLRHHPSRASRSLSRLLHTFLLTLPPTLDIHITPPYLNPSGLLSLTITISPPESPSAWASNYRLT